MIVTDAELKNTTYFKNTLKGLDFILLRLQSDDCSLLTQVCLSRRKSIRHPIPYQFAPNVVHSDDYGRSSTKWLALQVSF